MICVFLGKCDRWHDSIINYKENQKAQVINIAYRESLENYILRIINKVNLIATADCSYWVAGYDVGGSIACEVASKLVENGKVVYAYTFGAFNTRDSQDTKSEIKNIRNEDDFFVKYLTGSKPGQNYGASIFEDLMWEYRDLTENSDYEGNYIFTNYLLYVYDKTEFAGTESEETMLSAFDDYMINFNRITNQDVINDFADLCMLMDKWADGNRHAHSIKSYYVLAKSLNGFDLLDGDGEKQEHYRTIPVVMIVAFNGTETVDNTNKFEDVVAAIEKSAMFYINNVATYQSKLKVGGTEKRAKETNIARDGLKPYLSTLSDIPNNKQVLEDNKILYTFTNHESIVDPNNEIFIDNIESRRMTPNTNGDNDIYIVMVAIYGISGLMKLNMKLKRVN